MHDLPGIDKEVGSGNLKLRNEEQLRGGSSWKEEQLGGVSSWEEEQPGGGEQSIVWGSCESSRTSRCEMR